MSMGRRSLSRENSYFIFGDVANKARANSFVREEECHRKKRGGCGGFDGGTREKLEGGMP